jgi:hypothetical protein
VKYHRCWAATRHALEHGSSRVNSTSYDRIVDAEPCPKDGLRFVAMGQHVLAEIDKRCGK